MSWASTAARVAATTSRRLGNAVTIGGIDGYGILLEPAEEVIDGQVITTDRTVELDRAVFGDVVEGTAIVVDGTTYEARREGLPSADGSTVMVALRESGDGEVEIVYDGDFL